jgi:putative transposase
MIGNQDSVIRPIVIGYNPRWKQECHLGGRTHQNFVQLPLLFLIRQVQYKAALAGIIVVLVDERYTSRCSFVGGESVGRQAQYADRRVRRGLFRSRGGRIINADVNAAYNILQKAFPEAFADRIESVGLHPVLLGLT